MKTKTETKFIFVTKISLAVAVVVVSNGWMCLLSLCCRTDDVSGWSIVSPCLCTSWLREGERGLCEACVSCDNEEAQYSSGQVLVLGSSVSNTRPCHCEADVWWSTATWWVCSWSSCQERWGCGSRFTCRPWWHAGCALLTSKSLSASADTTSAGDLITTNT